jgi:GNAT superfamily N-acetyltransferase
MATWSATHADIPRITEIISGAFEHDPVWAVALRSDSESKRRNAYWRLFTESAVKESTAFVLDDFDAVSVWLPPGAPELLPEGEVELARWVEAELESEVAAQLWQLLDRFAELRPDPNGHAYLNFLATDPAKRGRGLGEALLQSDLERWDALGIPCYLESSNPANDHRYARNGFTPVGSFETPGDGAIVTTMWRDVRGT